MAYMTTQRDRERLFQEVMADMTAREASQRELLRQEGILEQIRKENEEAARILEQTRLERERLEMAAEMQREQQDRADARAREERRERKVEEVRRKRAVRAKLLAQYRQADETNLFLHPDAYDAAPIDHWVVENANACDDSLPVNFNVHHQEYQEWRRSPAYDEFVARVKSGEEAQFSAQSDIEIEM